LVLKEGKGTREDSSVPVWTVEEGKREQRRLLSARLDSGRGKKGTEKTPQCPFGRWKREKGNKESLSEPIPLSKKAKCNFKVVSRLQIIYQCSLTL
jgi:hypothetical protein